MTRRCRWILVIGCWSLSALVAPRSWESIGSSVPSTVYAAVRRGPLERVPDMALPADVRIAGKPRGTETPSPDDEH